MLYAIENQNPSIIRALLNNAHTGISLEDLNSFRVDLEDLSNPYDKTEVCYIIYQCKGDTILDVAIKCNSLVILDTLIDLEINISPEDADKIASFRKRMATIKNEDAKKHPVDTSTLPASINVSSTSSSTLPANNSTVLNAKRKKNNHKKMLTPTIANLNEDAKKHPVDTSTLPASINVPAKSSSTLPAHSSTVLDAKRKDNSKKLTIKPIANLADYRQNLLSAAQTGGDRLVEALLLSKRFNKHLAICKKESYGRKDGVNPLILASKNGHDKVVQLLLENGFNVNYTTLDDITSLLLAAHQGHINVVKTLLAAGADIGAKNSEKETTLVMNVTSKGHTEIALMLIAAWFTAEDKKEERAQLLLYTAEKGYSEIVEALILAETDLEGKEFCIPLWIAAQNGHLSIVNTLIRNKACINARDLQFGYTPLCSASQQGHLDIAEILCVNGAKKEDIPNTFNMTPEQIAEYKGHQDVAALIKRAKAPK